MKSTKHKAKKEEILHKGMEVMWLNGYNGTSVKDIVEAAGVPKGSFYFYFDSKVDFAIEAVHAYLNQMSQEPMKSLQDQNRSPLERLQEHYEYRIEMIGRQFEYRLGCFASNLAQEMSGTCEQIRKEVNKAMRQITAPIIGVIREAMEAGEINSSSDPEALSEFIENSFRGALTSMKAEKSAGPLLNFKQFLFSHLLK